MIGFHVPSFRIDSGQRVTSQADIAGHHLLNTEAAIFVYEDLLDEHEREIDAFQLDFPEGCASRVAWVSRGHYLSQVLPILKQAGRDRMRMPDLGRKGRRQLDALLKDCPEVMLVSDSFEQKGHRPQDDPTPDDGDSGKKNTHTIKRQVAVDDDTGEIVDIPDSVLGPTADIKLLEQSALPGKRPDGIGSMGDSGYQGIDKLHPQGVRARNPAEKTLPRTPSSISPPSPAAGLLWRRRTIAYAVIKDSPKPIETIARTIGNGFGLSPVWSIAKSGLAWVPNFSGYPVSGPCLLIPNVI